MITTLILSSIADVTLLSLYLWVMPDLGISFAIAHLALTLVALARTIGGGEGKPNIHGFALPVGAAFGPLGMLVLVLTLSRLRVYHRKRRLSYRIAKARRQRISGPITPRERLVRILDDRVRYPTADEVNSLAEILRYGNLQSRYKALEIAVKSFEPRLSSLILAALTDEDQTIRALAAAAASQVSSNLLFQRNELEARIGFAGTVDDRYALALLLADHGCHNELLPQAQRLRLCQEAMGKMDELMAGFFENDIRGRNLRSLRIQVRTQIAHHMTNLPRQVRLHSVETAA